MAKAKTAAPSDQAPVEPTKPNASAGLTPKQEAFAHKYVECGNASEAYRHAYDAENMSPECIRVEACRLLDNPKVALTVKSLRDAIAEVHKLTVADLLRELEEARTKALNLETPQSGAAVSATMGKAKLLGLDKQTLELTGKDGGPIAQSIEVTFVRPG